MSRDQDGHFKTSKGAWFCLADPGVATQTATVNCGKMFSDAEKPCSKGLGTGHSQRASCTQVVAEKSASIFYVWRLCSVRSEFVSIGENNAIPTSLSVA